MLARLHDEGGQGHVLSINVADKDQEAALIDAFNRERSDEYNEVVERTQQFREARP